MQTEAQSKIPPPQPFECFRHLSYEALGHCVLNGLLLAPSYFECPKEARGEERAKIADTIGRILCLTAWQDRPIDSTLRDIRDYAHVVWRVDDVVTVCEMDHEQALSREQAQQFLEENAKTLQSRLIELGHAVISDLLGDFINKKGHTDGIEEGGGTEDAASEGT